MYKYETHLHTAPVSKCAAAGVREVLECYKEMGYDGVFITNHFLDGNINIERSKPYEEKIAFYFSDYELGLLIGEEIGIRVFCGVEMSYGGTDFLVYGLDKQWFLAHPQIMDLEYRKRLDFLRENGGFVVQAHPFREDWYIDHIRLFPRSVDAVEVVNANRKELENQMAQLYAQKYHLFEVAGTDNHIGKRQTVFAGVKTDHPILTEHDYIEKIRSGQIRIFTDSKEEK